jgi:hypothetical protein
VRSEHGVITCGDGAKRQCVPTCASPRPADDLITTDVETIGAQNSYRQPLRRRCRTGCLPRQRVRACPLYSMRRITERKSSNLPLTAFPIRKSWLFAHDVLACCVCGEARSAIRLADSRPSSFADPRPGRIDSRVKSSIHGRSGRPVFMCCRAVSSSDEVDLVDHTSKLASADTDKHAFVQPVEMGCRRLDLR